jgi:GTPase SAR1 family protein
MEAFPRTTTNAYDHLLKILLVGDTSSNKSTLLRAYLDDSDEDQRGTTTLGLDYKLKDVRHKGKIIKLQLWDTAGQEKFRSVTSSYYRGAHVSLHSVYIQCTCGVVLVQESLLPQGALVCFTTDRDPSFLSLAYWLDEIRDVSPYSKPIPSVEGYRW